MYCRVLSTRLFLICAAFDGARYFVLEAAVMMGHTLDCLLLYIKPSLRAGLHARVARLRSPRPFDTLCKVALSTRFAADISPARHRSWIRGRLMQPRHADF